MGEINKQNARTGSKMNSHSLESYKQLISCDRRLQMVFNRVIEYMDLIVVQGFHPESKLCPTKEILVKPDLTHYSITAAPTYLLMFLAYVEGVAHGMGHQLTVKDSDLEKVNQWVKAARLPPNEPPHLTFILVEKD